MGQRQTQTIHRNHAVNVRMDSNNRVNRPTTYCSTRNPAYSVKVSATNAFAEPQDQFPAPRIDERVPSASISHRIRTGNAFSDQWSLSASPPSTRSMTPSAAKASPQAHGRNQAMSSCAYTQNTVVNPATSQNPSHGFQFEATGIPGQQAAASPPSLPPRNSHTKHSQNRSRADYNPFCLVRAGNSQEHQCQEFEQKQCDVTLGDAESIQLRRTVARLSLLLIQDSTAEKQEVVSKLLSCDVIGILYRSMFRYPQQTELQQETTAALNALQHWCTADKEANEQTTSTATSAQDSCHKTCTSSNSEEIATPKRKTPATAPFIEYRADLDVYECTECGKQYKHRCNLQSHSKIHTDQAYLCEFCGKKFGRKSNWMEHRRVHTGERPFICTVCQQTFRHKYGLKQHQRKKHSTI